jgi:predicted O-methyltransferase YrrM
MNAIAISRELEGIPHMKLARAQEITGVILENRFRSILELGFRHGVSTCYLAGAIDELGGGSVTTIDRSGARDADPNIEELLGRLGLARYVSVFYEPRSYIWRLMKMLEEDPSPRFDFCYIDGAHDWYTDGFAFFLVDRLLVPGGMIIFDDLDWTFATSPNMRNTPEVRSMPEEERVTPQIRKVYELLVKPHASYGEFVVRRRWAYARKLSAGRAEGGGPVRTEIVYQERHVGVGAAILKLARRLAR